MSDSNAETKEPPTQSGAESGQPNSAARMQELESELASANDRLLRALAEVENVRRRADRERGEPENPPEPQRQHLARLGDE